MTKIDDAMVRLCEEMRTVGGGVEFELALGDLIGRYIVAHERRMRDVQAANLLPLGPDVAAERLGVCRRTVYNMAERGRKKVQEVA
jgi:hypothetical protein